MVEYVSKKISFRADVLLSMCVAEEKRRQAVEGRKARVTEMAIIERALALYYGYLKGIIPEDVARRCFELAEKDVGGW